MPDNLPSGAGLGADEVIQMMLELRADTSQINSELSKIAKDLESDLTAKVTKAGNSASVAASKAGANMGNGFTNGIKKGMSAAVSTVGNAMNNITKMMSGALVAYAAFGAIQGGINLIGDSVKLAARSRTSSQILNNSISAKARQSRANAGVLANSGASTNEKLLALGINPSDAYETVSGGGGGSTPSASAVANNEEANQKKLLKKQIDDLEYAYKQEEKRISAETEAIKNNTKAQIEEIRQKNNYYNLIDNRNRLQAEIIEFQLQEIDAIKNNDAFAAQAAKNAQDYRQIDLKEQELKIKKIDEQTDKVDNFQKVQLEALRAELEASKNRLEIDTEPAKKALDEIQNRIKELDMSGGGGGGGGGSFEQLKPEIAAKLAAAEQDPYKNVISRETQQKLKKLPEQIYTNLNEALTANLTGPNKNIKYVGKGNVNEGVANLVNAGVTDPAMIEMLMEDFATMAQDNKIGNFSEAMTNLTQLYLTEQASGGELQGQTEEYTQVLKRGIAIANAKNLVTETNIDNLSAEDRNIVKAIGIHEIAMQSMADRKLSEDELTAMNKELDSAGGNLVKEHEIMGRYMGDTSTNYDDLVKRGIKPVNTGLGAVGEVISANPINNFNAQMNEVKEKLGNKILNVLNDPNNQGKIQGFFDTIMSERFQNAINTIIQAMLDAAGMLNKLKSLEPVINKINGIADNINPISTGKINQIQSFINGIDWSTGNLKKATGGYISGPGTGTSDSIPARLSNGEYVINAAATKAVGVPFLNALNALRGGEMITNNNNNAQQINYSTSFTPYTQSFANSF